jgi:NAD(P)-dependent dehydrogenase (short-subunit alcohol dehydrogenase family)
MKKALLIFGANGALGRGVTNILINKRYDDIYLFDFDFKNIAISNENIRLIYTKDLTKEENIAEAFKHVVPSKGKVFYLFSTIGGFSGGKAVWETTQDELEKMIDMNLKSSFLLSKYFSKLVSESFSGSICFTTAFTGLHAEGKKAAYGISKAALIHLVKSLALEGRDIKMSVNAIAPYIIDTQANREWMKDIDIESIMKPDEIGELIYSIFSNYHFLTGNIIELTHRFKPY